MDGQAGQHQQIPVHLHQARVHAAVRAHHQAARHGQGPVEPGRAEHTAVFLHIQFRISAVHAHFRVFFQLQRRGITVGRGDLKAAHFALRDAEGQHGGKVPPDKIARAGAQRPLFPLVQFRKTRRAQFLRQIFRCMEAAGTAADKVDQFLCGIHIHALS